MSNQSNIREEELKNRVATLYFGKYDCDRIVGNIDFCVLQRRRDPRQMTFVPDAPIFWAEAKNHPTCNLAGRTLLYMFYCICLTAPRQLLVLSWDSRKPEDWRRCKSSSAQNDKTGQAYFIILKSCGGFAGNQEGWTLLYMFYCICLTASRQ